MSKVVSWFSTGVSSAVATKLAIDKIDEIIYINIDDQHSDSLRFVKECESWFDKEIKIIQSDIKTVEDALRSVKYISGPAGSPCTRLLKVTPRLSYELLYEEEQKEIYIENGGDIDDMPNFLKYVWGMDYSKHEMKRASKIIEMNPNQDHLFPLIDKRISKVQAHEILKASGIKRPVLYDLGFKNNNCLNCVKATSAGYWYLMRKHFPEEFAARARLEREIGATIRKKTVNGETVRLWLDELGPEEGKGLEPIVDECGILCDVIKL